MLIVNRTPDAFAAYEGIVKVRDVPQEWDEATFFKWWARMKDKERDKYTAFETKNLITTAGLLAINSFLGSTGSSVNGFAKYLALGTGALAGPAVGDTSLVTESFRKVPGLLTITGNTTDITTYLLSTDAQSVLTEAGLYTGSASGTLNSGTLATHLLFSLNNAVGLARSVDYLIVRN